MSDTKICRNCEDEKPVSEFYLKRTLQNGDKLYRPDCRACAAIIRDTPEEREYARLKTAAWREADPDKARQSVRDYQRANADALKASQAARREDPIQKVIIAAQRKASYDRNAPARIEASRQYALKHPEKTLAYMKAYWKANPDKATEYRNRRKALKLLAGGTFKASDIADIRKMQGDRCANPACRIKLNGKGHVDHRVALTKGGSNDRRNLQLLCAACNSKKHTTDEIEFVQAQGFLI